MSYIISPNMALGCLLLNCTTGCGLKILSLLSNIPQTSRFRSNIPANLRNIHTKGPYKRLPLNLNYIS